MKKCLSVLAVLLLSVSLAFAGTPVKALELPKEDLAVNVQQIGQCGQMPVAMVQYDLDGDLNVDMNILLSVDPIADQLIIVGAVIFEKGQTESKDIILQVAPGQFEKMSMEEANARFPLVCDIPVLMPRA